MHLEINSRKSRRAVFFAAVFLWAAASSLLAVTYTVTDLGTLTNVTAQSDATISAINPAGKAVGISASNTSYNSFIYDGSRTNLGTLGGASCLAQGINPAGIICGGSMTTNGVDHAFRWTPGATTGVPGNLQMADLGTLGGGSASDSFDINPSGQIAGVATVDMFDNIFHACRFNTNGTVTDIGQAIGPYFPGGPNQTYAYGINQAGQVVGSAYDNTFSTPEGFFYNGAGVTMLGDLTGFGGSAGNYNSEAFAINGSGQVVGYATYSGTEFHAICWAANGTNGVAVNPRMVDLGTLGGTQSSAWSINSSNVVVGRSLIAGDVEEHAFITVSNTMVDLNTLLDASSNGWLLIKAEYINDAGQIVGRGTSNGALHGFLLTALTPPSITNQPAPVTVLVSNSATFTVGAGGTAPLAYQWRLNTTTNVLNATNASLTITNVQATNAGNYTVVVTNSFGSVTSSPAALTVNFPPGITNQPTPVSVVVSNSATFTVGVSGTAPLAYQWRLNTTTNLLGATNFSLTITNAQATNAGNYTVVITNSFGSITSSPAALTVNFPPFITNQPASQSVLVGSNAAFAVGAGGTSPRAQQWKFNATTLAGATNSSLSVNNAQPTNAGNYTVVITNSFGSITSSAASLTVVTAPQLTGISVLSSNVLLGFTTSTGATYFVESRTDLAAGSWLNTVTNVAGVGGTKNVTHTNGAGLPLRFYRVRVTVP